MPIRRRRVSPGRPGRGALRGRPGWVRGKQDTGEIGSSEVIEGILISGLYHISVTEPLTLQFLQQFDWGE
jgi:hypothetical protein